MLQQVVEEHTGEIFPTRRSSKTEHADICAFCLHLEDTYYIPATQNNILKASLVEEQKEQQENVREVHHLSLEKKKGYGEDTSSESDQVSCSHCKKKGHDDEHCWKLHSKMKGKKKIDAIAQQDCGLKSENETQIEAMVMEGKTPSKSSSHTKKGGGGICKQKPTVLEGNSATEGESMSLAG